MILSTLAWVILGLLIAGVLLYVIGLYNSVITLDRSVNQVFGNLESVMKQRHDELPKLVNACQAYMEHERGLLEKITALRSGYEHAANNDQKVRIENDLNAMLSKLNVAVESYPDLKASQNFLQIHDRITALETTINDRREQFNQAVTNHNITIAQFPALLVTSLFKWQEKAILEIIESDKTDNLSPFPLQGC